MKRIYKPALPTQIPLTLMQQIPMYEYQRSSLDLSQHILLLHILLQLFNLKIPRELPPHHILKPHPSPFLPHKPTPHPRPPMRAFRKAQTPVLDRSILKRDPKSHRARRVRV